MTGSAALMGASDGGGRKEVEQCQGGEMAGAVVQERGVLEIP